MRSNSSGRQPEVNRASNSLLPGEPLGTFADPGPHLGRVYELIGPRLQDMHGVAREYSDALTVRSATLTSRRRMGAGVEKGGGYPLVSAKGPSVVRIGPLAAGAAGAG